MLNTYINKKEQIIILFIIGAVLCRLLPHLPNFTPITAIALFGGAYLSNRYLAYLLPLGIMVISDLFLGFYAISFFVYAAFIMVGFIGTKSKKPGVYSILAGSLTFFIISNFGVWLLGYPKTISGLMECYTLAIPFFRNALMGDLFYGLLLIYGFKWVETKYLKIA